MNDLSLAEKLNFCLNSSEFLSETVQLLQPNRSILYTELSLTQLLGINIEEVPFYLLSTSESFRKLMQSIESSLDTKDHIEEIRQIGIVMFQIFLLEKLYSLWITYRRSGFGILILPGHIKRLRKKIWPLQVRSRIQHLKTMANFHSNNNDADHEDHSCRILVDHCLKKLDEKSEEYHGILEDRIKHLTESSASSIVCIIETFVRQRFMNQRLKYDCEIELVQYEYIDELLKYYYLNENPNEKQVKTNLTRFHLKSIIADYNSRIVFFCLLSI